MIFRCQVTGLGKESLGCKVVFVVSILFLTAHLHPECVSRRESPSSYEPCWGGMSTPKRLGRKGSEEDKKCPMFSGLINMSSQRFGTRTKLVMRSESKELRCAFTVWEKHLWVVWRDNRGARCTGSRPKTG